MPPRRKPQVEPRKTPRQARSRDTVEVICTAATRVLDDGGLAAVTTNRVAERAGVSIGSLYEYFPNRDALLIALTRRMIAEDGARVRAALLACIDAPPLEVVRGLVRAVLALHREKPARRRALLEVYLSRGLNDEEMLFTSDLIGWVRGNEAAAPLVAHLAPTAWYALTRTVLGGVRLAFWERNPLLHEQAFEDELVTLVLSFLAARR